MNLEEPTTYKNVTPILIGLFLFLQLLSYRIAHLDLSITDVDNQLMGTLMSHNVDVTKRISFYLGSLLYGGLLIGSLAYIYSKTRSRISNEKWAFIGKLSVIGLFNFCFMAFTDHKAVVNISLSLLLGGLLKVLLTFLKKTPVKLERILILFALSIVLVGVAKNILDTSIILNDWLSLIFLTSIVLDHFLLQKKLVYSSILHSGIFLLVLTCIFNEFQFLSVIDADVKWSSLVKISGLLLVFSLALLGWNKHIFDNEEGSFSLLLNGLLLVIVFMSYYTGVVSIPDDQFELANVANSYMRVFHFGERPFVDFVSSHMLYDQLPSYLYGFIYGYEDSLGFTSYDFIYRWIVFGSIYWFLTYNFKQGLWPFLFLLFFPFVKAVFPYSPVLLSVILIHKTYKDARLKNFIILGGYSFFLFFWKLDIGIANFLMVIGLQILLIVKQASSAIAKNFIKAMGLWSVVALFLLAVLCLCFSTDYLFTQLSILWDYIGANTAHGLPDITYKLNRLFYFHYFGLPILIVLVGAITIKKVKFSSIDISILALSIFYFANFQRGLVRHSLTSGTDTFLSSFGILIIALFITNLVSKKYSFVTLALSLACLVPLTEYGNVSNQKALYSQLSDHFEKANILKAKSRVPIDQIVPYQNLRAFMEQHYSPESSFIDLTNHPMSYFYTQRKPPSYFNQYLQNTVTEKQQQINIDRLRAKDIPVVLYRSENPEWLDETDGLPNQLRYSSITRYVHDHYVPYRVIDGKHIWLKKQDPLLSGNESYTPTYNHNLGHIPGILSKQHTDHNFSNTTITSLDSITLVPYGDNKEYLSWQGDALPDGEHAITIYKNENQIAHFLFKSENNRYNSYLLPVDWLFSWTNREIGDVYAIRYSDPRITQVQILRK